MIFGIFIDKGPANWQILQQINGYAEIELAGRWDFDQIVVIDDNLFNEVQAVAAVFDENDGSQVIPWQTVNINRDGTWSHTFEKVPAGGLYRIETGLRMKNMGYCHDWDFRGDMIHHLGVGDLYVIAGQSNAVGYAKDPIYDPPEYGVHMFRSNGTWDLATHPFGDSTDSFHDENTDLSNTGHSPFLTLGKKLKENVNYPIGLIPTALGGSAIRQWDTDQDGMLWKAMMRVIDRIGGKISGILWYQGCTDADRMGTAEAYLYTFTKVVEYTRKALNDPELPWFTVQLNHQMSTGNLPEGHDRAWGMLREQQRKAALRIPGVYVTPCTDCTLSDGIHNKAAANMMLGQRMARMILKYKYGIETHCDAPDLYYIDRRDGGNSLGLHFTNVEESMVARGGNPNKIFMVEDDGGIVEISGMTMSGNVIELKMARQLMGRVFVSGLWQCSPEYAMPVESTTRMPFLSFYRKEVRFELVPWRDRTALYFNHKGRDSWVVIPPVPEKDRRWAWRTEFFGAFDYADMALNDKGYYLVHHSISNMYGCPKAVEYMEEFYKILTEELRLGKKAVLIGLSRGGLYAYNFALAHPEQVACLYLDAPVLDIRSWPGGKGVGPGDPGCWKECMSHYGLTEKTASDFKDNPLDHIQEIADAKIPVMLVAGLADQLLPYSENGEIFDREFRALGGKIKTIAKPNCDHHPHSLEDPTEIIEFIEEEGLFE